VSKRYLIICQNPSLAASLKLWLEQAGYAEQQSVAVKTVGTSPEPSQVSLTFEDLADWVETELDADIGSGGIPVVLALTDLCGYGDFTPNSLNPIKPGGGWEAVLGMLVLSFPEMHWIFSGGVLGDALDEDPTYNAVLRKAHSAERPERLREILETIMRVGSPALCDGTGLRNAIRMVMDGRDEALGLPRRSEFAIAVDEERSYAWLHAYTAYRFGYRAYAVTTYAGMQWVLNPPHPQPTVIFEDYFLHFSDVHPSGFSHLRERDKSFGALGGALGRLGGITNRILVTSGHHRGQHDEARMDNPTYLRELRSHGKWNCELNKPLGGIFNLWKDSGLLRRLHNGGRPGLASGFYWPKAFKENYTYHSTPGRLLVVAERLIGRADRLLSEVRSVPHAVRGALLATDAIELLGGKTPTTSLEALRLKHEFEALAECQFVGTQQHMDVKARMKDIRREMGVLSAWFGSKKRQRAAAAWNAELSILNKLIDVYRDHNQFDEEQMLQVRARGLHRRLQFVRYPAPIRSLEVFPWYVEKMVSSFALFLAAIAMWVVILGGLYAWASGVSWNQGLADAFVSFVGIGPSGDDVLWQPADGWNSQFWLVAFTLVLGFVHLGIFISHLYSMISRK
jgi:hypothetical protein